MLKYNHEKLADVLIKEYKGKYGSQSVPKTTISRIIECMDDAFVDEWAKDVSNISATINQEAENAILMANNAIFTLKEQIKACEDAGEKAKEAEAIHDERVADALKVYQIIVNMDFDTPQQKLQNIQNASYFIWALYFQPDGNPAGAYFKDINSSEITDVKEEDADGGKTSWQF